jgi:CBS domain-containing protein
VHRAQGTVNSILQTKEKRTVVSCATTTTLADVVFFLNKHRILSVPVINDEGEVSRYCSTAADACLEELICHVQVTAIAGVEDLLMFLLLNLPDIDVSAHSHSFITA